MHLLQHSCHTSNLTTVGKSYVKFDIQNSTGINMLAMLISAYTARLTMQ